MRECALASDAGHGPNIWYTILILLGFPNSSTVVENPPANSGNARNASLIPWVEKTP